MDKPRFVRAIETALSVRFVETKSRNGGVAWSNKDLALGHLIDHLVKKTYHVDTPKSSCNTLTRSEPTTGDWYIINIQGNDRAGKVVITPATPAFEIGAKTRLKATTSVKASALEDVTRVYKGLTAEELKEGVKLNPGQLNTLLQIFKSTGYRQSGTGANMTATSPDGEALQITIKGDDLTIKLKE